MPQLVSLKMGGTGANSATDAILALGAAPSVAYDQANSAYTAANNRVLKAGDTMTGRLYVSNTTAIVTNGNSGFGTETPNTVLHVVGTTTIQQILEQANLSATGMSANIFVNMLDNAITYLTANSTANSTINFRGNTTVTLNTMMSTNQTLTAAVLVTNNATAYRIANVQVDGTSVTPKWSGGTAPTASANSVDTYSFTIIKTGSAAFTVLGSKTQFAQELLMPVIASIAAGSVRGFGRGLAAGARASFTITPAVSGKSAWDMTTDGKLTLGTSGTWTIVPDSDFSVSVKVWGAGGGSTGASGAAGGAAVGTVSFQSGLSYQLIVGGGGAGGSGNRNSGGGGAGSGIQYTTNTTPIIVAGGGGGSDGTAAPGVGTAGGGGGTTGQDGIGGNRGFGNNGGAGGGTQSAAGPGGVGARRTGSSGSGRNGGNGSGATTSGPNTYAGGTGFGSGGVGAYDSGDAGGGGGGGGYYGGGGGGGDAGGLGGGGGSGYLHPSLVTGGTLYQASYGTAGNSSDSDRSTSGNAGATSSGVAGKIVFVP